MLDGADGRHHLRRLHAHHRGRAVAVPAADQPVHAHALRRDRRGVHRGLGRRRRQEEGRQGDCGRHQGAGGKAGAGRHVGHDGRHAAHAHGRRRRHERPGRVGRGDRQRAHRRHGRQRRPHLRAGHRGRRHRRAPARRSAHRDAAPAQGGAQGGARGQGASAATAGDDGGLRARQRRARHRSAPLWQRQRERDAREGLPTRPGRRAGGQHRLYLNHPNPITRLRVCERDSRSARPTHLRSL